MRDFELEEVGKPTLESARATLERKSKIYEKLSKGKSGGLSDKQYSSLLVDVSPSVPVTGFMNLSHNSSTRNLLVHMNRIATMLTSL